MLRRPTILFLSSPDINASTNLKGISFLERPWQRINRNTMHKIIFILEKMNYNVYANIVVTSQSTKRIVTLLDTGAASSFKKMEKLPHRLRQKVQPPNDDVNVRSASRKQIPVRCTSNIVDKVETNTETVLFYVLNNLATAVLVGCNFCDREVDVIRPRLKIVRMDAGATITIVQKPLEASTTLPVLE